MTTPESEYRRVVRHQAGHTLGFPHEHLPRAVVDRIDREKAYRYFQTAQGWPREVVDDQVLTPVEEASVMGTPADQASVMGYQLPASVAQDGRPILGGADISAGDFAFAGRIYPKSPAVAAAAEVNGPLNVRRCQLIDKKHDHGLTREEQQELDKLQSYFTRLIDDLYPLPEIARDAPAGIPATARVRGRSK